MKTLWTEVMIGGEVRFKLCVRKNGRDHRFLIEYLKDGKWNRYHRYEFPIEYFNEHFPDIHSRHDVVLLSLYFLIEHFNEGPKEYAWRVYHVMSMLAGYLAKSWYKMAFPGE